MHGSVFGTAQEGLSGPQLLCASCMELAFGPTLNPQPSTLNPKTRVWLGSTLLREVHAQHMSLRCAVQAC